MAINIRAYSRDSDTSAGVGNAIIQQHHAPPGSSYFFFFLIIFILILSHIIFLFDLSRRLSSLLLISNCANLSYSWTIIGYRQSYTHMCSNLAQTPGEKRKAGQQMFARSSPTHTHRHTHLVLFFSDFLPCLVVFHHPRVYKQTKDGRRTQKNGWWCIGGS